MVGWGWAELSPICIGIVAPIGVLCNLFVLSGHMLSLMPCPSTVEKILMIRSLEDGGNQQYEYLVKWQGFAYVHCRLVSNARISTPVFAFASLNAVLCSISH